MLETFTEEQAAQRHPVLAFFSRRPVTVSVIVLAVTVLGAISLGLTPIELFPGGLEGRSVGVSIPYSRGDLKATPLVVEKKVTLPVEGELATIPGIKRISSSSSNDESNVWLEFDQGRDMDEAYVEVMDAHERARLHLPQSSVEFLV